MPRLLRTPAIALHSVPFAESSKVVTFFTRDFGKLNFLAKGARRPRSKFGAALETFTYAQLIIYKPEKPKLYILSDAEIIHSFPELLTTPEYYLIGSQIIEFVLKAVDFEEPNAKLFNLLLAVLFTLTKTQSKAFLESLALAFYLKAGSFLGYRPELNNCVICRKSLSKFSRARPIFDKSLGGLLCPTCKTKTQNSWELTYDQLLHLKALLYLPLKMALTLEPKPELNNLILQYLKHHFPKLDLKTECYFRWNNQA